MCQRKMEKHLFIYVINIEGLLHAKSGKGSVIYSLITFQNTGS